MTPMGLPYVRFRAIMKGVHVVCNNSFEGLVSTSKDLLPIKAKTIFAPTVVSMSHVGVVISSEIHLNTRDKFLEKFL